MKKYRQVKTVEAAQIKWAGARAVSLKPVPKGSRCPDHSDQLTIPLKVSGDRPCRPGDYAIFDKGGRVVDVMPEKEFEATYTEVKTKKKKTSD